MFNFCIVLYCATCVIYHLYAHKLYLISTECPLKWLKAEEAMRILVKGIYVTRIVSFL